MLKRHTARNASRARGRHELNLPTGCSGPFTAGKTGKTRRLIALLGVFALSHRARSSATDHASVSKA